VPKRGFVHKKSIPVAIVNLKDLNRFPRESVVDPNVLAQAGLVRSHRVQIKILGEGTLSHPLTVKAHRFSKSAFERIGQAGGTALTVHFERGSK
jgi:large subunit ribosomal protein L15